MGVVCPLGVGDDAVWASVEGRRSGVRAIPEFVAANVPIPFAGDVVNFEPKAYVKPRKSLKVMCRETQLGFAAAEIAWEQSGLEDANLDPERFGVTCGSNMYSPDVPELADAFHASDDGAGGFDFSKWGADGLRALIPLWMLKYLPNMTPCHIGIAHDARGPSNSVVAGDVSGSLALIEAADVVARGHADVMIAGGVSSTIGLMDVMWHGGARQSRRVEEPERACRPFDADRDGWVGGEAAALFVLERRTHAEARGAKSWGRIAGHGRRNEASAASMDPTGQAIRLAIEAALADADLSVGDIGHVNAHGLSTQIDDMVEAQAIRATVGDVVTTAPKSFFGNAGPAASSVELAISLMGLQRGVTPPTLNYETPDPDCPINVAVDTQPTTLPTVLKLCHRTTGQAVALIVEAD